MSSLVAIAAAVAVSVTSVFTGPTKHKHYRVALMPQCFTRGCIDATALAVEVTTGNARHPAAPCVYGTFQLPNAKIHRDGSFSVTGHASTVSRTFALKVTGVFTGPHRVRGTVTGPKVCGGSDGYRLSATIAAGS